MGAGTNSSRRGQAGVGLIEALISILVLGFILAGVSKLMVNSRWSLANTGARNDATYNAERIIDSLQALGVGAVHSPGTPGDTLPCPSVGNTKRYYRCVLTVADKDTAANGRAISKDVTVRVFWTISGAEHSIQMQGAIE